MPAIEHEPPTGECQRNEWRIVLVAAVAGASLAIVRVLVGYFWRI